MWQPTLRQAQNLEKKLDEGQAKWFLARAEERK
jgi:hypothetical protein